MEVADNNESTVNESSQVKSLKEPNKDDEKIEPPLLENGEKQKDEASVVAADEKEESETRVVGEQNHKNNENPTEEKLIIDDESKNVESESKVTNVENGEGTLAAESDEPVLEKKLSPEEMLKDIAVMLDKIDEGTTATLENEKSGELVTDNEIIPAKVEESPKAAAVEEPIDSKEESTSEKQEEITPPEETKNEPESENPEDSTTIKEPETLEKPLEETVEETSEIGIVGPPTAASELINEEELKTDNDSISTALPTEDNDCKASNQEDVAKWVEKSAEVSEDLDINNHHGEKEDEGKDPATLGQPEEEQTRASSKCGEMALQGPARSRFVTNIIKRSIKCLNKMHAMDGVSSGNGGDKKDAKVKDEDDTLKVPLSQQNGAALPEETAAKSARSLLLQSTVKVEYHGNDSDMEQQQQQQLTTLEKVNKENKNSRKRRSFDLPHASSHNGNSAAKKICQREQLVASMVGDKLTADELAVRAEQLRAEVQTLDDLARAKEMEWNEILRLRKVKEEAYLRIERKRQIAGYLECNNDNDDEHADNQLPPASLTLAAASWSESGAAKDNYAGKEQQHDMMMLEEQQGLKGKGKSGGASGKSSQQRIVQQQLDQMMAKQQQDNNCRSRPTQQQQQQMLDLQDNRQVGEGRQGPTVDVRSIIADYRLRHPESVPRRGRRMRNSVNVNLGAGGAMMETGHSTVDSRPSSTDSCKSNPTAVDPSLSMSYKDVLVQFAKMSQQQGEPIKTPQHYPDVTLHPVAPGTSAQNPPVPQQGSGSLLHGILTKSQSPRAANFSPTLARLLTAPERERNPPINVSAAQQSAINQQLQAYQGNNPVSISELLSSSKARTEITITPVNPATNASVQSHSNSSNMHEEYMEEDSSIMEERESISRSTRDSDSPPRCQGCHERAAQFVCAGCGNQWYCSRECQVSAWDDHSDVCSG